MIMNNSKIPFHPPCLLLFLAGYFLVTTPTLRSAEPSGPPAETALAREILRETGVRGGLIVHLGCGDGKLTAALRQGDAYLVHGLDRDVERVRAAREHISSLGLYGPVSVDRISGDRLPYVDNLANLVVIQEAGEVPPSEVKRVLCPGGIACVRKNGSWTRIIKTRPEAIDEWTHYLHDASNNAVSQDRVVAPPNRLQWAGSPRFARHHDRMSSVSAVVTAGGRIFYIFDEASRISILIPPRWTLIARDAFNGTILWKRHLKNWHTHLWPLKSGPAQLPRRLVAAGDRVYVTLSLDGPVTEIDAATGNTIRTYEGTRGTEEILLSRGILFLLVNPGARAPAYADMKKIREAYGGKFWDEKPRRIQALRAESGELLWDSGRTVLPGTLAAGEEAIFFHDGRSVVSLHRKTGAELWRSDPVARVETIRSFYIPILLVYGDVVLFSGGETAGNQTGSWYTGGKDTMTALSAKTGKVLWTAYHPPSGYRSPEDMLVAGGLVWTGETTSGRVTGVFTGRDPRTGEVVKEFPPDIDVYWFHHRCYRGKATENYLLMARAGTEFIDINNEHWIPHHWFRGACLYGILPANGLIYAPQNPCACYLETKQLGFNALAPATAGPRIPGDAGKAGRLEKGPAYGQDASDSPGGGDWPTYRHDAGRSGTTAAAVPPALRRAWAADVGGRLTSPVIAGGRVFVASVDTHTVHALDAATGKRIWSYTTGGRVDSPPTIHRGRVYFGSADGRVYCLRASDGALAWRFRAAPLDQRLTYFEQVESVWPLHGSVLIQDGVLYCVAGRSMFLDGGLRFLRLHPETGRLLSENILDNIDPETGKDIHSKVSWLNMPPALPDILSSDGRLIYMKSQPFRPDGTRLPLKKFPQARDADAGAPPPLQNREREHLFCPTGFLDDSWWHRTYWLYGSDYISGWCGYYLAGKAAPAGRILVFDDSRVYGFGRKPQYYRWTTPMEHHLFAAEKRTEASLDQSGEGGTESTGTSPGKSQIRVEKSKSLNLAGKAVTAAAWIKAEQPRGVILARGGGSHGYALYLKGGRPFFGIRINQKPFVVSGREKVTGRWAHLAGILTGGKELQIYVDGKLAATVEAPGSFEADPQEAMEIGADEGSRVGDYSGPFPFKGLIDEVRIYHRALGAAEVEKLASAEGPSIPDASSLVLSYSFDGGNADDGSGNQNRGTVDGATSVEGKKGRAMRFTGKAPGGQQYLVNHLWTRDLSLFPRAMVLAGGTLLVAGPPDLLDEEEAFRKLESPEVRARLLEQAASLYGKKGAVLLAVSAADGNEIQRCSLESTPVFDGMAAAGGRLYLATTSGKVLCFGGKD